jgi:hypothetical protein
MHRLYLEMHEPRAFAALGEEDEGEEGARASGLDMEDEEDGEMGAADADMGAGERKEPGDGTKPFVKYDFYNERFRLFDLAFGKPEVDSCAT